MNDGQEVPAWVRGRLERVLQRRFVDEWLGRPAPMFSNQSARQFVQSGGSWDTVCDRLETLLIYAGGVTG